MALLLAGFALFVLNIALDWRNGWIALSASAIVLLGGAYNFRMLWLASAPKGQASE